MIITYKYEQQVNIKENEEERYEMDLSVVNIVVELGHRHNFINICGDSNQTCL